MDEVENRFLRQASLVPREALADLTLTTVVGVGAIGRQVALQLAALGVRQLVLVDFHVVEATNTSTQGYLQAALGLAKVEATAQAVRRIDPTIRLELVADRFRPNQSVGDALFCCVDAIATRVAIWRSARRRRQFWCDGRMLGEVMRILTVAESQGREHYATTLFHPSEAQTGTCTARGVLYTASIAAGFMVHQFTRWLRGLPVDPDLSVNLLASELAVA